VVTDYSNLTIEFVYEKYRLRNPLNILQYIQLSRRIKSQKADAVYLNVSVSPWCLAMLPFVKSSNTVVSSHQGRVHEGMGHKKVITWARSKWYGHFKNVNMFSKSQAGLLKQDFPESKIFQFVLGLKEFGKATNQRPDIGDVRFLSFGTLNYAKNIDLLIDAACFLHERGVRGFKVSINGACKDWSWYQRRIKYPEIFELDIRMIDNREIPNLFNGAHYFVQPYRVVSQSGPMKIAFNYNLPDITSDLPGFTDEIVEGVNGYTFEAGSAESLADKMQWVIEHHKENYPKLLKRMRSYTEEQYAEEKLIQQYVNMFEEIDVCHE
jgi:glycosyltransferase involved in cell wall biosynthesis